MLAHDTGEYVSVFTNASNGIVRLKFSHAKPFPANYMYINHGFPSYKRKEEFHLLLPMLANGSFRGVAAESWFAANHKKVFRKTLTTK